MNSNYARIFVGNRIEGQALTSRLEDIGIKAVVKDEAESARKAGFASPLLDEVEVYIHNDQLTKAEKELTA